MKGTPSSVGISHCRARNHLARQLGVVRFVGVEQTDITEPPKDNDPDDDPR